MEGGFPRVRKEGSGKNQMEERKKEQFLPTRHKRKMEELTRAAGYLSG